MDARRWRAGGLHIAHLTARSVAIYYLHRQVDTRGAVVSEHISFETDDFAANPEPRCPCVLLLDVSKSMTGKPLSELNAGLATLHSDLADDPLATKRVEIAIVTFGPVRNELPFTTAGSFYPPELSPQGDTPMGDAILTALELLHTRKNDYRTNGISYYRPWVFLITDGAPTDDWTAAAAAVREGESTKAFAFFAIGVKGADMATLRRISVRDPLPLEGFKFRELFRWLSTSLRQVSRSTPGGVVALPPPEGWTAV
jgi:uncharacterized protein YegL